MGADSYYSGQPGRVYQVDNIVLAALGANLTVEKSVAGLTGVALLDVGFVVPLALPVLGCNFMYARGSGNDTAVIGVQNVSEGSLDFADTQDVLLVFWTKTKTVATVTGT